MASNDEIKPFKIDISKDQLDFLKSKLDLSTFPDGILPDDDDWSQGPPLPTMRRLVDHWRNDFDWQTAQAKLNKIPQFTTSIDVEGFGALNVHFLHVNKGAKNAIPLVMIHGWPGTFYEMTKILSYLTDGKNDEPKFEVVVPSLIGYGFSDGAKKPGFSCVKQGEMCHKLMLKLGFNEYVAQGGDWGMVIAHVMANVYYPQHLKAVHINNSDMYEPPSLFKNPLYWLQNQLRGPYTPAEKAGIERTQKFLGQGLGYNKMHSHRPQTIGYSIQDSPSGLLAWILDKLHDWTDDYPWTDDEVLTWVSIFWFSTSGPTASFRLYYESQRMPMEDKLKYIAWAKCPMGISHFPKDINVSPLLWARPMGNFVFERAHDAGGHFAAWEKPQVLASDLKEMFKRGGPVYGAVSGRDGS
ncbi:hypothetical protein Dda_9079 [Drechslerella dactyloides]|uniref:Epoxide hydrolase N-terminal domain-containing protein n=1 Tax=Drechslerella dactyloides TaxID=74499 RepID=A0AAD6IPY6_DREDA|nr:hypothetical protein Dda_9079 [Drechslerella dactyloides]